MPESEFGTEASKVGDRKGGQKVEKYDSQDRLLEAEEEDGGAKSA